MGQGMTMQNTDNKQDSLLEPTGFQQALNAQLNLTEKLGVPCAMLLLRLEFEDLYVNQYDVGDLDVLRETFAGTVSRMVRDTDTVGWLEEGCLAVILRAVTAEETTLVATRLQRQMSRRPVLFGQHNIYMAVQLGGVWTSGDNPMPMDVFTEQAYFAMMS